MKKKILIALAILAIPAIALATNVGLGGEGLFLVILSNGPTCPGTANINEGAMYYDAEDNKVLFCNGTDYQTLETE